MIDFLRNRWFLFALILVLILGGTFAKQLQPVAQAKTVQNVIVFAVMFLMALPLQAAAIWQTVRRPWAPGIAILVNMGLLPLVARMASPLLPESLGLGLLVAATTPCTLASAAVFTRRAGGNDAVAILVTVFTNASCFLITPAWLVLLTGREVQSGSLTFTSLVSKLAIIVVLPMAIAQVLRLTATIGEWATRNKILLGVLAQIGVLSMVLVGAIQAGTGMANRTSNSETQLDLLLMCIIALGIHLAMFGTGFQIARVARLPRRDQIAIGFSGSQKTLMIGITMATSLKVSILPMVAYHILQLLADTAIADHFRRTELDGGDKGVTESPPTETKPAEPDPVE